VPAPFGAQDIAAASHVGEAAAVGRGRRNFLSAVYRKYHQELLGFVHRSLGNTGSEAEDVIQQAFIRFAERRDLHEIRNPRAFLYRTARNIAINHHRHRKLVQTHARDGGLPGGLASDELSPEIVLQEQELCRIVEETIRAMPPRRREFLLMHRVNGLAYAEIARRAGVSDTAVKKHVALAVAACGLALEAGSRPNLEQEAD
jgi:RNA polymerase sigma-70 factor (ECF subfamily)